MTFPLLLIVSAPSDAGPFVWFTLGTGIGIELILWGAYRLHDVIPATRWAGLLKRRTDAWFPLFLLLTRKLLILVFSVLLWFTLQDMGFPSSPLINILFVLLLIVIPIKGFLLEYNHAAQTPASELLHDGARYLIIMISSIFTATVLTTFGQSENTTASEINLAFIFVWLISILVVITCLLLFLSRLPRHRPDPSAPTKDVTSRPRKNAPKDFPEY